MCQPHTKIYIDFNGDSRHQTKISIKFGNTEVTIDVCS